LKRCEVEELILDRGPWYKDSLQRLSVRFRHETFGERSSVESVYSPFKERAKIFFCSITVNFRKREFGLRWRRALERWKRFCRMFVSLLQCGEEVLLGHVSGYCNLYSDVFSREDCQNSLSELHPVSKTSLWNREV